MKKAIPTILSAAPAAMKSKILRKTLAVVAATVIAAGMFSEARAQTIIDPTVATDSFTGSTARDLSTGQFGTPTALINGSGLDTPAAVANGVPVPGTLPQSTNTYSRETWRTGPNFIGGQASFTFTLDTTYTLNGLYLWNYTENYLGTYYNGRGVHTADIQFSTDGGTSWGSATGLTFTQAPDTLYVSPEFQTLAGISANAVKLTINSNFDSSSFVGLNEIRFTTVPEPGTWAMVAGGFGMVALLRRRRVE